MPKIKLWTTDKNGNSLLHTTVVLDKRLEAKEVIHHVTEEIRDEQRKKNTKRIKHALEDLENQNHGAVLEAYRNV